MATQTPKQSFTRRDFLGSAAAAGALALLNPRQAALFAQNASAPAGKPNSVFGGVHIGTNTYSYRGGPTTAEYTLDCLLKSGLSEAEFRFWDQMPAGGGRGGRRGQGGDVAAPPTTNPDLARLRETQLAKCVALRKMYNDAGVNIHAHKLGFGSRTDEDIEFSFLVAKALGAKAITDERDDNFAKRVAPFADKHRIWVAFHNHETNFPTLENMDPLYAIGDHIGFNFDIGHYVAGNQGKSPIPVLEKYHSKIFSLHLKDRTADGGNLPWGQGQTPIKEVLQLLKKEKWLIYADIELEYQVPQGSDSVKEVAKCVQYCKEALA